MGIVQLFSQCNVKSYEKKNMKRPNRNASQTSIIKLREFHPIPMKTFNINWMKLIFSLLCLELSLCMQAQTTTQNYIVTTSPFQAVSNPLSLTDANSNTIIQYIDGVGRLSQTVQKAITPLGADLVSAVEYDVFSRESKRWLPAKVSGNNGAYYSNYATQAVSSNGNDAKPYSTIEYEPSPMNRVSGQYGPGDSWYANSKKVATTYSVNSTNVKYFYVESDKLKCNGYYATATLYGQQTSDEDGKTVIEYTDKQGRLVLSRRAGSYDTYYVYDDFGNLRYVLPPLAADGLSTNTTGFTETSGTILYLYGYIYHYDGRKRCTEKKMPGAEWEYMVYDKADRLILSQDGNQKLNNKWTVNKYDKFGRLLYSGILNNSSTRTAMETSYSGLVTNESYSGSGSTGGYTCTNLTPSSLLVVNYYDSYSFLNLSTYTAIKSALTNTTQSGYTTPDLTHVKTTLTGTCTYHLDDAVKYELSAIYYDKYGRTVQTRASNHLAGYDIDFNLIDFTGKPTKTYKTHGINGASNTVTEVYSYTFDKAQRMLTTTHQLNGGSIVTLTTNTYDELGRLATKTLHGTLDATTYSYNVRSWLTGLSSGRFSENLYYNTNTVSLSPFTACYNGNISGMKWSIPAENLGYDRAYSFIYDGLSRLTFSYYGGKSGTTTITGATGKYNERTTYDKMGNILTLLRIENGSNLNNLTYTYTGNQLLKVDDAWSPTLLYGSEAFNDRKKIATEYLYDKNGNAVYDANAGVSTIQYNLLNLPEIVQFADGHQNRYSYSAGSAKLTAVSYTLNSAITVPQGTISPLPTNPADYIKVTTDYIGSKVYQNGSLKQIQTSEGYCQAGVYYYYLKDHLGNTRVVINSSGTTVEKSHYYPFGMRFFPESTSNSAAIGFRYNGKEFETMNGLNRYDYGKRMYDPALGRWHVADSRAEKYFSYSPYNYCANNPLNFIDPQGDTIKYAGATEEAAYNDYKNTVKSRVQAYDKRTQTLRDKGKTERADKRDANRSDNAYVQIQGELGAAESDENIFMIRMGGNISNKAGDGNISYNSSTQEIDVNISLGGGWTTMQKVAHEFKHVDQFINFMLDLNPNGGGGLLYDKTDEVAAFERQNLFGTRVDAKTFVNENYSDRREGPKSFHLLTPIEQTQYKSTKYIYHGKK
jgi:RHS repeat-associated protein